MATITIREASISTKQHCYVEFSININNLETLYKNEYDLVYDTIELNNTVYFYGKSGVTNLKDAIFTLTNMVKRVYGNINVTVNTDNVLLDNLKIKSDQQYLIKLAERKRERSKITQPA